MKRIGRLNGKVVVQGDPNLVTKGQILYKQQGNDIILQERKNNKLENITAEWNSNSQGYKESYYKVINKEGLASLLDSFWMLKVGINGIILDGAYMNYRIHRLSSSDEIAGAADILYEEIRASNDVSIAFSYSHKPITCVHSSKYNSDIVTIHYPEGDWLDRYSYYRLKQYEIQLGRPLTEEEKAQVRELFESGNAELESWIYGVITPISKEEFEALITNK